MKSKATLMTVLILMLSQISSCTQSGFIPVSGEDNPTATVSSVTPPSQVIGTISKLRTPVQVGKRDKLELLEGESDLDNDDFVKITNGGKARLEFPGPITLLLFNQSDMDGIKLEYDENSNPRIVNRLIRGGFSGYVEPGRHLTIDLAFGVQVNVLGTNFFVIFDETTGYLSIGKFVGTLTVSIPGQNIIYLHDAELADITSDGKIKYYSSIPFTPAQFDSAADSCYLPSQGVNILRRDNNIPLPGQETVDKKQELPCAPLIPSTAVTQSACPTPVAYLKVKIAKMRTGPDLRFSSVGDYKIGARFAILGKYQQWFQVMSPDSKKGWLYIDWLNLPPETNTTNVCAIPYHDLPPTPPFCYGKNSSVSCP